MGIYLILSIGLIVFGLFVISLFFMVGDRMSTGSQSKNEIRQLQRKVEDLERKFENK